MSPLFLNFIFTRMLHEIRGEYIDYSQVPPVVSERRWTLAELNFDHVGIALLTLFTVQTRDNWPRYVRSVFISYLVTTL